MDKRTCHAISPFDKKTGLQNNLNRWYDPAIGRWLSEDPIGFRAGDANLYRYVGNGPVNGTDPSGLDPAFCPSIGIGSGFYRRDPVLPIDGAIQEPQYIWVCLGAYGCSLIVVGGAGTAFGGGGATAIGVIGGDGASLTGPGVAAACTNWSNIQRLIDGIRQGIASGAITKPHGQQMIRELLKECDDIIGIN